MPSSILTMVGGAAVLLAACSSDTTSPSATLTRAEALAVAGNLAGTFQQTPSTARPATGGAVVAADPFSFTHDINLTSPCPQGGTLAGVWHIAVSGDDTNHSLKLDASGTATPSACAYLYEGVTITVDGSPNVQFESHAAFANNQASAPIVVKVNGAFHYSTSDNRSGTCSINYQEATDLTKKTRVRQGSVCGVTVSDTLTWS